MTLGNPVLSLGSQGTLCPLWGSGGGEEGCFSRDAWKLTAPSNTVPGWAWPATRGRSSGPLCSVSQTSGKAGSALRTPLKGWEPLCRQGEGWKGGAALLLYPGPCKAFVPAPTHPPPRSHATQSPTRPPRKEHYRGVSLTLSIVPHASVLVAVGNTKQTSTPCTGEHCRKTLFGPIVCQTNTPCYKGRKEEGWRKNSLCMSHAVYYRPKIPFYFPFNLLGRDWTSHLRKGSRVLPGTKKSSNFLVLQHQSASAVFWALKSSNLEILNYLYAILLLLSLQPQSDKGEKSEVPLSFMFAKGPKCQHEGERSGALNPSHKLISLGWWRLWFPALHGHRGLNANKFSLLSDVAALLLLLLCMESAKRTPVPPKVLPCLNIFASEPSG